MSGAGLIYIKTVACTAAGKDSTTALSFEPKPVDGPRFGKSAQVGEANRTKVLCEPFERSAAGKFHM